MNYIDNLLHFYDTTQSFEVHRKQGLINPDSICFLRETGQIYTQGSLFGICKERFDSLEQLVLRQDTKIKDILGVEGPSVNDGFINNLADLINFLDGFTDEDNLKEFLDAMKQSILAIIKDMSDNLRQELDSICQDIRSINSQIDTIDIKLDNYDTVLGTINTTISGHLRDYSLLKNSYESFKQYSELKFTTIDNSLKTLNESLKTLQQEFVNLDEKFDNVENEVAEVKTFLEDAKRLVQEVEDRFGETLAIVEQFKRDINEEIDDFKALVGAANGIAPLDADSKVPSAYLPSYVDDVLEYATKGAFPVTGESGKIYVALDDNLTYRWSGTTYIEISKSLGLGETATTAYSGNKGKKNADDIAAHKADTNNPHNVTKTQLGLDRVNNTSDEDKPISIATQSALNILNVSISEHITDQTNPHNVSKTQIGLGNVDNTADLDKPISKATQDLLNTKVDKIVGKGLSTNDFTNEDKFKLDNSMSNRKLTSEEIDNLTLNNEGDLIYNISIQKYVYWDGTSWREVGEVDLSNYVTVERVEQLELETIDSIDALEAIVDTKVEKVIGKGLSTNDFTDNYKIILDNPWGETIE